MLHQSKTTALALQDGKITANFVNQNGSDNHEISPIRKGLSILYPIIFA